MATKTYDPKQMKLVFGPLILGGFMDGTFLEAERDEETFSRKTGAAGEQAWVKSNNRGGKITFTVMQQSATNDGLSAIMVADELLGNGILPFAAFEANGTTVLHAGEARIAGPPKLVRAKEMQGVEYHLDCADIDIFNGGLL